MRGEGEVVWRGILLHQEMYIFTVFFIKLILTTRENIYHDKEFLIDTDVYKCNILYKANHVFLLLIKVEYFSVEYRQIQRKYH